LKGCLCHARASQEAFHFQIKLTQFSDPGGLFVNRTSVQIQQVDRGEKGRPGKYFRYWSSIMKPNPNVLMSALMVGMGSLVSPTHSIAIFQINVPYLVGSAQAMPSGPDFSQLSLSTGQQAQLQNIQLEIRPQIMEVLTPSQQVLLEAKLARGQTLWQGIAGLDLSGKQQSKIQNIMKSQRFKIVNMLTPEQREKLMRSGKPPF
jgi:periplasmic protein CpxP/Spy